MTELTILAGSIHSFIWVGLLYTLNQSESYGYGLDTDCSWWTTKYEKHPTVCVFCQNCPSLMSNICSDNDKYVSASQIAILPGGRDFILKLKVSLFHQMHVLCTIWVLHYKFISLHQACKLMVSRYPEEVIFLLSRCKPRGCYSYVLS